MQRNTSYVSVAAALAGLTEDQLSAIAGMPERLKEFAAGLAAEIVQNTFVFHLSDVEAIAALVSEKGYASEKALGIVTQWRKYATAMGYNGPVAWRIREGFMLKQHAPQAGPTFRKLTYLQDCQIKNDEPTKSAIVFWVPRLAEGSLCQNVKKMEELRTELRKRYELPENHGTSLGSIALLFALILAHFKRTGERVPLQSLNAASDTFHVGGLRLIAGSFDGYGLSCGDWIEFGNGRVGFFLLGVEILGT
ncbi:hypothetical protein A3H75_00360 [Candidatus Uhrbacteria bacterium RIFCSPLOWO2_02_FULL_51_9]|uniref:Uncharacterized protein n=1 Tax=Candidatus Uhrbacteria bacterium RIFCSPLOWO2_02_FULL_51_9 TaxID=1802410 RepID=A0A1F7VDS1_9BACT|nr:MAG: hypothetical protein A3H75_00360 [Candidatus Uhrbacteria bacterium RIFCSPLOWO2_02_FULL_51_9]